MPGAADILLDITAGRRRRLAREPGFTGRAPVVRDLEPVSAPPSPFLTALAATPPAIIAEVKLGSPRLGDLTERIDVEAQAGAYATAGAAALSVVVEPDRFHGSYELLERCRVASDLPTLAKDFVVDPMQLEWAQRAGASAVLLIAALYRPEELAGFTAAARRLGMVALIEVHDEGDLDLLSAARGSMRRAWGEAPEWDLIGVNNRNLRTFEVDLTHSERMAPLLPETALKVAESGIGRYREVVRLAEAGFDAFLVGESLLLADDPARALRELTGSAPAGRERGAG